MPRAHAPLLAAILGVGLVLAFTRSPEAGVRLEPVAPPTPAIERAAHVGSEATSATAAEISVPPSTPGGDVVATPVSARPADAPIVVEHGLARFTVPRDRLALSPAGALSKAPLALDHGPTLVALVASWCRPCAAELPVLLRAAQTIGARVVLVAEDDVAGPESLRAVIEDLFARTEPTSRTLPALELRADPEGAWLAATGPLLAAVGDPGALPQTLLFDRGRLALLVQGPLDDDVAARFETHLAEAR